MPFLYRAIVLGLLATSALAKVASADSPRDQIPLLIKSLKNANVRYGASLALTKLGTRAVPALRKSLASGKGDVPVWSAYTLGQIGPAAQSAVGDLIEALVGSDDALRAAAAQALGQIGPSAAAAVGPLANALTDTKQAVRTRAAVALGQIGPSAKNATGKLIGTLSDSKLRKHARKALTRIGPAAVTPLLKSLGDDKIRFDVSIVLLQIDPKGAKRSGLDKPTSADVPALRLVLNDPARDSAERTAAASALASLKKEGVPVLIAAFENKRIARTAATAFAQVGPVAVPALIKALADKKADVRSTAADALGHIGPAANAAAPHLIRMLADTDRSVRYHVVRTLHTFGKKAKPAIPALIKVIGNNRESEPTRQWAIKTLIVTLPETRRVVVKALIAASKDKKNYGVSQLARQQVRKIDLKAAEAAGVK
ncbi:MAG: HEAT repeat domain-containing protein [Planctomycetes bacterium]|nr:HEAT repeat domain-containing protein [Planctomycetota bacterium]